MVGEQITIEDNEVSFDLHKMVLIKRLRVLTKGK